MVAVYLLPRIEFINCCCNNKIPNFVLVLMRQHSPPLSPRLLHDSGPFSALFFSRLALVKKNFLFSFSAPFSHYLFLFPYVPWPHWTSPFLPPSPLILILSSLYGPDGWQPKPGFSKRPWQTCLATCATSKVVDKMLWKLALSKRKRGKRPLHHGDFLAGKLVASLRRNTSQGSAYFKVIRFHRGAAERDGWGGLWISSVLY